MLSPVAVLGKDIYALVFRYLYVYLIFVSDAD